MKNVLTKNEVRELLYKEYLQNNSRILTPKELEDKEVVKRSVLKRVYGKLDVDLMWKDVADYFKCNILTTLEQSKLDLIEKLRETAKVEGEPVNSKLHRDLYCKGCKLFGSWRELNMAAGLKVNSIKTATIDIVRKDEMIEKMILITCINKNAPFKSTIQNYKNMPTFTTLEKLCDCSWEEIINILHLNIPNENKYKYKDSKELLLNLSNKLKETKLNSLFEYSFLKEDKIEFIYIMNKTAISWEWLNVLMKNNFVDCNSQKFKYTKKELSNILSFKYILLKRQLNSTEINNDTFLPNVMTIMKVFKKNIYEVWKEIEKNPVYEL